MRVRGCVHVGVCVGEFSFHSLQIVHPKHPVTYLCLEGSVGLTKRINEASTNILCWPAKKRD